MIALDTHAHIAPTGPGLADLPGVTWDPDAPHLAFAEGGALASPSVFRPEALLRWMDTNGIARAWISAPPPLYRLALDEAAAAQWLAWLNPAQQEAADTAPDRLAPVFHLPIRHPALAAEIVRTHQGPRRFAMAAGAARDGVMLSDPAYEPLWQTLDGATLMLHPVGGSDPRLDPFFLHNLLGGPGETALAAAHLVLARVPERHPAIRFILSHGGGSLATVAGRIARGQHVRRPGADTGAPPMTEAIRHFQVDCITHSAPVLHLVADAFGADNILFGSDWPFSMGLTEPHTQLAGTDPDLLARIFAATED